MVHGSVNQLGTILVVSLVVPVESHSRFGFPTPRSPNTGIKSFPCGSQTNDFSGSVMHVQPGSFTVVIEESIAHTGSPWRISLSGDTDDSQECMLLDHIPHDDNSRPRFGSPNTYHKLAITIEIPDVACERCSLHLANPMTDKIGSAGAPAGSGCTDPGSCPSVYYSCSMPMHINGSIPRSQYNCPGVMPSDWPQVWIGDGGRPVNANVSGNYRRESASWGHIGEYHWLLDAPTKYRKLIDNLVPDPGETEIDESLNDKSIAPSPALIGAIIFVVVALCCCFCYYCRHRKTQNEASKEGELVAV